MKRAFLAILHAVEDTCAHIQQMLVMVICLKILEENKDGVIENILGR